MPSLSELTKLYYTIGEVAEMYDVKTSLLRYWEKEFKELKPKKSRHGDRRFTKSDIAVVDKIYDLVKKRGFTLEGAKRHIKGTKTVLPGEKEILKNRLSQIKDRLISIKNGLG